MKNRTALNGQMTLLHSNHSKTRNPLIFLLLVLMLALILAGCDLPSLEDPQSLVESTPTAAAASLSAAQPTSTPLPDTESAPEASPPTVAPAPGAGGEPRTYTVQP